jgi:hypothetical protein
MSSPADTELAAPQSSIVPKVLGLLALAVLAVAFIGALFGSLRNGRWDEGDAKGEVARLELARLEFVIATARERLAERETLRARLPLPPESSRRVRQLANLVERNGRTPLPPYPERSSIPTSDELEDLDEWLDGLYRRIATGRDVESRLPDLESEIAALHSLVDGTPPGP